MRRPGWALRLAAAAAAAEAERAGRECSTQWLKHRQHPAAIQPLHFFIWKACRHRRRTGRVVTLGGGDAAAAAAATCGRAPICLRQDLQVSHVYFKHTLDRMSRPFALQSVAVPEREAQKRCAKAAARSPPACACSCFLPSCLTGVPFLPRCVPRSILDCRSATPPTCWMKRPCPASRSQRRRKGEPTTPPELC